MPFLITSRTLLLLYTLLFAIYFPLAYFYPRLSAPSLSALEKGLVVLGSAAVEGEQVVWVRCESGCRKRHGVEVEKEEEWTKRLSVEYHTGNSQQQLCTATTPATCRITVVSRDTVVITLLKLESCREYKYTVKIANAASSSSVITSSTFHTPPLSSVSGCFPSPEPSLTFFFGSCLSVSPFSDIRAFRWILNRQQRTDLVLLLGDVVYVDIPAVEDLHAYQQVWTDAAFSDLFKAIPMAAVYDDHEIVNDWALLGHGVDGLESVEEKSKRLNGHQRYHTAMRFYDEWVGSHNPAPPSNKLLSSIPSDPSSHPILTPDSNVQNWEAKRRYYTFDHGKHASFFVLDTRQYASPTRWSTNESDSYMYDPSRTKLGAVQKAHLFHWLLTSKATFKFLCSSVSWSSRTFKFVQDGWAAYRAEREEIFEFIRKNNISGVILLSSDLHYSVIFHFIEYNLYEFTISPIQSFPLPHWLVDDQKEKEEILWKSKFWMHIAEIQVLPPSSGEEKSGATAGSSSSPTTSTHNHTEARVRIAVYKYLHGEPQLSYENTWTASRLSPQLGTKARTKAH